MSTEKSLKLIRKAHSNSYEKHLISYAKPTISRLEKWLAGYKEGLHDFFGKKDSTPKKVKKRKERNEPELEKLASEELPKMAIPKKKKRHTEPKRNGEFMSDKNARELKELLEVPIDNMIWCFEVCKGMHNFRSKAMNLDDEVSTKLVKMFNQAKSHFECQKCLSHSTELAQTQFIWCDRCKSGFHRRCADLDDEEVRAAPYQCELCIHHAH